MKSMLGGNSARWLYIFEFFEYNLFRLKIQTMVAASRSQTGNVPQIAE